MEHERSIPDSYIRDSEEARELAEAERPFRNILDELHTEFRSRRGIGDDPKWAEWYAYHASTLERRANINSTSKRFIQEMRPLLLGGTLPQEIKRLHAEAKTLFPHMEERLAALKDNPKEAMGRELTPTEKRFFVLQTRIAIGEMLLRAEQRVQELRGRGLLDRLVQVFPQSIRRHKVELEDELVEAGAELKGGSYDKAQMHAAFIEELEVMVWIAQKIKESEE